MFVVFAVKNTWQGGYWGSWTGGFQVAAHLAVTLQVGPKFSFLRHCAQISPYKMLKGTVSKRDAYFWEYF